MSVFFFFHSQSTVAAVSALFAGIITSDVPKIEVQLGLRAGVHREIESSTLKYQRKLYVFPVYSESHCFSLSVDASRGSSI